MSAILASPLPVLTSRLDRRYLRRGEGAVTIPAAISQNWTPVATIQVPQQDVGFIIAWFAEVNDPSWDPANSSIAFQVNRNTSPYATFESIRQPMGDRLRPEDTMLQVLAGDSLIVAARRIATGGGPQQVVAGLRCILWPLKPCGAGLENLVGQ